jgi:hypothetical protein
VTTLRRQVAEGEEKCRRLEAALAAAQQDGAIMAARLQGDLSNKQEENGQLADMVLQQREEIDSLKAQQLRASHQADESSQATMTSIGKLQEAAAEWRRRGEDSLQALAAERERSTLLQQEGCRLREQLQALTSQREAAAAELAALKAKAGDGSAAAVAELKEWLGMERSWRKAVGKWLKGEVQTQHNMERVLLNVGSAVRCGVPADGAALGGKTRWGQHAPASIPLAPRRVAASQLAPAASLHVAATPCGEGIKVTVSSPTVRMMSVSSRLAVNGGGGRDLTDSKPSGTSDWRQHFKSTMKAFDERHSRLQQELSNLRRDALQATQS